MIAITGSNGFLGKIFINYINKNYKEKVLKLPKIIIKKKFNSFYFKKKKLSSFIIKNKITYIVHFAGVRKNICESSYFFAKKSIFNLTKNICKEILISNKNIKLIYISTDHVFDGCTKFCKESNLKKLKPNTNLGKLKLLAEKYLKKKLNRWSIIRLSAVMDDIRLSSFVMNSLKKKKKISLYSNVFFTPVLSDDLNRILGIIIKKNLDNNVYHCSGNKRLSKYNFYKLLFKRKNLFIKDKLNNFKFNPHDLSLSNKQTCKILKIKMTNFNKSLRLARKSLIISK